LLACGSNSNDEPPGNGPGGSDASCAPEQADAETSVLLDQSPQSAYQCSISNSLSQFDSTSWANQSLAAHNGSFFMAGGPWNELRLSSIALDGTVATLWTHTAGGNVGTLVNRADTLAFTWTAPAGDPQKIYFGKFDTNGQVLAGPKAVATPLRYLPPEMKLLGTTEGYTLLWIDETASDDGSTLQLLRLDEDGEPLSTVTEVFSLPGQWIYHPRFVPITDGYAAIWEHNGQPMETYFASFTSAGQPLVAPRRISRPSCSSRRPSLVAIDQGFLAAWSEVGLNLVTEQSRAVIWLAKLDSDGEASEPARLLELAVPEVEDTQPVLVPWGQHVALFWSRGTSFFTCGGCVADHTLRLTIIDPQQWKVLSELVELSPPAGGILRLSVAQHGEQLLTVFNITFHALSQPGSAAFRCESSTSP